MPPRTPPGSAIRKTGGRRSPRASPGTGDGTGCSIRYPGRMADGSPAALNTCFNCVDRHVEAGRGEQAALIWDSPMTGRIETFTYAEMHDRTAKLAGALAALGVHARRPGGDLHADGARGGDRHAGLRAAGRDPFRGVRRLRRGRTGGAHRRREAEGDRFGLLRAGARAGGEIQAAARRGDRAVAAQAGRLPDPAARAGARRAGRRAATTICWRPRRPRPRTIRVPVRGDRSAVHPLHLRHHRAAEGRRARQWRPCGRAVELDADDLWRRCGRRVLGRLRCRLGGRAQLHRLCAAAARLHQRSCTRASRSARRMPARSGGCARSTG